ncbi:hypothetical protein [Puniceibacterium sediminis]|uniref:Uncharacterized protein n=1 Tax=Puniceibacterium sediminis TaxID=1608407 RepID=A0A238V0G6_9RHOB|nr:hypothetical protein [Puniceibacterium sediminis]SNR27935.1 hypothetical protein SAMN06265370_101450 [Puniceibacterium sediminis]
MTTDVFIAGLAALTLIAALIVALTGKRDRREQRDNDRSSMG